MSKLAIIFHGITGGMAGRNGAGNPIDLDTCAKTIHHNIISHYDTDIFVHSWSIDDKDAINFLYSPKESLYEKQEMFDFKFDAHVVDEKTTAAFRRLSRYTSLTRAMLLKQDYERENNFKYDWILVLRFDLIVFNKLDLNKLKNDCFYLCSEPHWPDMHKQSMVHDIAFLSSSNLMDTYCNVINELNIKQLDPHRLAYQKLRGMFKDMNKVRLAFRRYEDMEIYRMIMDPTLNKTGHQYGALETKPRLEKLLEEINGT